MDKDFLASRISPAPRILGLKLRPFSLGHWLILQRADSPFVSGSTPEVVDVIFAVLVCSLTFEEAASALDSEEFGKQIVRWVKTLRKLNFIDKLHEFQRYWFYGNQIPSYSTTKEEMGEWSGTPWPQRLKIVLMSELGFSESDVLNRPLRMCWWDYLCFEERRGNVTVLSEDIQEAEQKLFNQANELVATSNNANRSRT